jgi:hypothetical protein
MGTSPMIFRTARNAAWMSVDERRRDGLQQCLLDRYRSQIEKADNEEELTLRLRAVLSDDPERASEDLARLDVAEGVEKLLGDGASKLGESLNDLSDKGDDVDGGRVARVADEFHKDVNDRGGDFGEPDGAGVNGLDEELAVLEVLLVLRFLDGVGELLLEDRHDVLDVPARDHLQRDPHRLPLDSHVVAPQHPQHVRHQRVKHPLVLLPQRVESVEHDELDVVVALLDAEVDETARCSLDRRRVLRQARQARGGLVLDGPACGREEFEDSSDPFGAMGSVGGRGASFASDEVDDGELEKLVERGDGIEDGEQVLDRSRLGDRAEGDKGVSLAGRVGLGSEEGEEELGRVWDEVLVVLVDGKDGEDGVLSDVGVAILHAASDGRDQRLEQLSLVNLLDGTEGSSSDVLVGVLLSRGEVTALKSAWFLRALHMRDCV